MRYVDTKDKSLYWQSNDGGATYNQTQVTKQYYKPLPSFNLAYDLDTDKVLRFSVAKVMARPRYGDLAGSFTINSSNGNLTASGGNPDLKPYESTNYDLAAEWYFAPSSMLSAELFYRDISSYIVTTTTQQQLTDAVVRGERPVLGELADQRFRRQGQGRLAELPAGLRLRFRSAGELHLRHRRRQHRPEPAVPVEEHLQRDPLLGKRSVDGARQLQLPAPSTSPRWVA